MFPLTHIYCAKKIFPKADYLFLYGSIFPDIPGLNIISWKMMESKTIEFSKFIKSKEGKLTTFANGLLLHEKPIGIDRFVHGIGGYAYVHGKKIQSKIRKYFPEKDSLKIAHSFIEFAVEIKLVEKNPQLQNWLKQIINKVNNKIDEILKIFSEFFHTDLKLTKVIIQKYNELLITDISSRQRAVKFYTFLTNTMRNIHISEEIINQIIDLSIKEIEEDYESFLNKVIQKCRNDIAKDYPNLN